MEEERQFYVKNNTFISDHQAIAKGNYMQEEGDKKPIFWIEEIGGPWNVHLTEHLVCQYKYVSLDNMVSFMPTFMRISLFKIFKHWIKAWTR